MKITRMRIIAGAGALAILGVAAFLLRPKPVVVDTALVSKHPLETVVEAYGRTRVRERFLVVAPVGGRVERIERVEGARVRAGDVVARITPAPLDAEATAQAQARVDAASALALQAAAQVRVARATIEQRRRERVRVARLVEAGAMAPRQLEEAQLAVIEADESALAAEERVKAADADVRQARAVLSSRNMGPATATLVRAPVAGRVLRITERSARIIAPGTPLMEIGDPGSVEVVADLLSSDVAAVQPGDRVRFLGWTTNEAEEGVATVTGRVRVIEPSGFTKLSALGIEEQRVNVIADLDRLPPGVGDGFRVNVAIVVWSSPSVLSVPRSALLPAARAGAWTAFVVRDGRIEQREIRIGHVGGSQAEVLDGLAPGDSVVIFPSDRIRPGLRVTSRS